jgi:hypothetical protein
MTSRGGSDTGWSRYMRTTLPAAIDRPEGLLDLTEQTP